MAYTTTAQVQGLMPFLTLGAASSPTITQVGVFITECQNEIDSALSMWGIATPITAPAQFVADLGSLNAMGAAAKALMAAFPSDAGANSSSQGGQYWRAYQARLTQFRQKVGIPVGLTVTESDQSPRSYFTDSGAIGVEGATDAFGAPVDANPAFSREMQF